MVTLSQSTHISNHYFVYLKRIQYYANYISIKLEKITKKKEERKCTVLVTSFVSYYTLIRLISFPEDGSRCFVTLRVLHKTRREWNGRKILNNRMKIKLSPSSFGIWSPSEHKDSDGKFLPI